MVSVSYNIRKLILSLLEEFYLNVFKVNRTKIKTHRNVTYYRLKDSKNSQNVTN